MSTAPAPPSAIIQIEPWIDESEINALSAVIASTYLVEAGATKQFEEMTAALTGARFAIAVCNGTAALYVALKSLGVGPGDEVIVPNMTFIATANAVLMAGATPVFCEVREDTFCLDVERAAELISSRTRALLPVHLYGQSADMEAIAGLAGKHSLAILEDAAQGVGVHFQGKHVGTFGQMGILSYYGNKTITTGEGGMILTDDSKLAESAYRLKNHGRDKKGIFLHEHVGFNFSFTDLQAAVGIAQMNKLQRIIARKKRIHDRYIEGLRGLASLQPAPIDPRCAPVFWFTSFLAEPDSTGLAEALRLHGIQTRRFFYPLHQQPCYQAQDTRIRRAKSPYSISESIYRRGISLPSSYALTDTEQDFVIAKIRNFYAHCD